MIGEEFHAVAIDALEELCLMASKARQGSPEQIDLLARANLLRQQLRSEGVPLVPLVPLRKEGLGGLASRPVKTIFPGKSSSQLSVKTIDVAGSLPKSAIPGTPESSATPDAPPAKVKSTRQIRVTVPLRLASRLGELRPKDRARVAALLLVDRAAELDLNSVLELCKEIKKIGNLLNQSLKFAYSSGGPDSELVARIMAGLDVISSMKSDGI